MTSYHWRIILSLLVTIPLLWMGGKLLPSLPSSSVESNLFWTTKAYPDSLYDVVFIGDSRIYRGIDPSTVAQELSSITDFRVFNFGFSSAGLDTAFMDAGAAVLDKSSKQKVIILGVSPSTLADENMVNTHYYQEKNRPKTELWQRKHLSPYLSFFDPTTPTMLRNAYHGNKEGYFQKHHLNGWIASTQYPIDVWKDEWMVRQGYEKAVFSLSIRQDLIKKIKEWTAQGIRVFAFRPPAVEHFEKIENEYSKLSQAAITAQIEAVGGTWIEVENRYSYQSYDGNHLMEESAVRLSAFLGKKIKENLQQKEKPLIEEWSSFQQFETTITAPWAEVSTENLTQTNPFSGTTAHLVKPQTFSTTFVQPLDSFYEQNLSFQASCWMRAEDFKKEAQIMLVVSVEVDGKAVFWEGQSFEEQVWVPSDWNKISKKTTYYNDKKNAILKIYVWNNSEVHVIIDDFKIEITKQ